MSEKNSTTKNIICKYLKEGMSKKDSVVLSGISEPTLYRWIDEDESFKSQVEASILEYKHELIKNLVTSTSKDGRLALEILSRRYPQDWGANAGMLQKTEENRKETENIAELYQKIISGEFFDNSEESNQKENNRG